jgi:spore coat polysaccharide biosynthesis protein SpsF (cytidylyltransferase family)
MKVAAIVQARMGSSRLPGKVIRPLAGVPVIQWIFERLDRCVHLDAILVATGDGRDNDVLAGLLEKLSIPVFRGSEQDVLDRYYRAAKAVQADAIVRITGDCPLIDPGLVDEAVSRFLAGQPRLEYVSNIHPPTYPDGLDVEVFSIEALFRAWREAEWASEREHVTLYMRNHPERFVQDHLRSERDWSHYRWTLDEEADYRYLTALVELAEKEGLNPRETGYRQWLALAERYPELFRMNGDIMRNEGVLKSLRTDRKIGFLFRPMEG